MARLPKKILEVPFDKNGNQLDYGGYSVAEWKDNYEFTAKMRITDFIQGRSSAGWYLVDEKGHRYYMFMSELLKVINAKVIDHGTVVGTWTFRKQGANYSIKLVVD